MSSYASTLAQFVPLAPSVEAAPRPIRPRRDVVTLAEDALFSVGILGSLVMMGSFLLQILG